MNYVEPILPEFDREMANTRKVLERVPNNDGLFHRNQVDQLADGGPPRLPVLQAGRGG